MAVAVGRTHEARGQAHAPAAGMVFVPAGSFAMGSDRHYPEEAPVHRVALDGFWMDRMAVTNRQFAAFVEATGHVTLAERAPRAEDYPGAPAEMLKPGSLCFQPPPGAVDLRRPYAWWAFVHGADWRHPDGPESGIEDRLDHPVVHVAHEDAVAYARWAGKDLPTEAEWEYAARGGLDGADYAWGDELAPDGRHLANTWQGTFPWQNLAEDGFTGTAPTGSFPANAYGLHEMIGNVWEWTVDWYAAHRPSDTSCCTLDNPRGGGREASVDPATPETPIPRKVIKGGSFLCAPNYCQRYRPAARLAQPIDSATCHIGFRCVIRPGT